MTDYSLATRLDPLIHQRSRLAILAVLAGADSADFIHLREATGLTKGTLSKHLSKLEGAGYLEIEKGYKGNYPHTLVRLSSEGRHALRRYRRQLGKLSRILPS